MENVRCRIAPEAASRSGNKRRGWARCFRKRSEVCPDRRRSHLLVERALRRHLLAAVVAISAGHMMENHHPFAQGKARYALSYLDDGSRHFMAEDARRWVRAGMNLLQIRSADAACSHFHQQFSRPDSRHGNSLHAHVVHAAIDHSLHGAGNLSPRADFKSLCRHYAF